MSEVDQIWGPNSGRPGFTTLCTQAVASALLASPELPQRAGGKALLFEVIFKHLQGSIVESM